MGIETIPPGQSKGVYRTSSHNILLYSALREGCFFNSLLPHSLSPLEKTMKLVRLLVLAQHRNQFARRAQNVLQSSQPGSPIKDRKHAIARACE